MYFNVTVSAKAQGQEKTWHGPETISGRIKNEHGVPINSKNVIDI